MDDAPTRIDMPRSQRADETATAVCQAAERPDGDASGTQRTAPTHEAEPEVTAVEAARSGEQPDQQLAGEELTAPASASLAARTLRRASAARDERTPPRSARLDLHPGSGSTGGSVDRLTSGSAYSITTTRDTLELQDVSRTRSFVGLSALVALAIAAPLPLMGGDPLAKTCFAASMLATAVVCAWLYYKLRDPFAYDMKRVLLTGYTCIAGALAGIFYFGAFSPAAVVIPFGLYFFGLAQSFRSTLSVYLTCAVGYLLLALPVALHLLPDRGVVKVPDLGLLESIMVILIVEVMFLATYLIARFSRRATQDALEAHDSAVRAIAGRDALLAEARMDLDGVLRARGLGRFTDEVVGNFRLGPIIGRGGMGEVYEATHVDSEKEAAVKLLHPHVLRDADAVKRFGRECRAASALRVANVVKVLEVSGPDAPVPYIAMEQLHGQDLAELLRARGRLRLREVLRLVREVGRGLEAARAAGIVHRDIKPRNLFCAERVSGGKSTWKILDFGVSKLASEATMTQQHVVGTPSYMAPEQAKGGEVSHLTDLYALGVIAYRALTGRPPFSGESAPAILYQVVNEMPPAPTEVAHHLGPEIDAVLLLALAKRASDRFDSADDLADALEKAARGRLPAPIAERAERVLKKHPWG